MLWPGAGDYCDLPLKPLCSCSPGIKRSPCGCHCDSSMSSVRAVLPNSALIRVCMHASLNSQGLQKVIQRLFLPNNTYAQASFTTPRRFNRFVESPTRNY